MNDSFNRFCELSQITEPYSGTRSQRGELSALVARMVSNCVQSTRLLDPPGQDGKGLDIPPDALTQVALLKELTWVYVIDNPALAGHQFGQRKVIRTLFEIFSDAARHRDWALFPPQFREEAEDLLQQQGDIPPARSLAWFKPPGFAGGYLLAPVPWGHRKTTTFVGALRQDGLIAPCAFDGPINGETFRAWAEQFLVTRDRAGAAPVAVCTMCRSNRVRPPGRPLARPPARPNDHRTASVQ